MNADEYKKFNRDKEDKRDKRKIVSLFYSRLVLFIPVKISVFVCVHLRLNYCPIFRL